jgi:FkbM family methyltransferase
MIRGRLLRLGNRFTAPARGRVRFQPAFERLHRWSLLGMGIGTGDLFATSGELRVLRSLPRGSLVLDVGANVGGYTRAALAGGHVVHSFEPSPVAFAELERAGRSACLHPYGLGDIDEEVELFSPEPGSGMASVYLRRHPRHEWTPQGKVRVRRLDDVALEEGIEKVDLLKLDVEGHELAVLRGATQLLAGGRVERIQFEFGGTNIDARTYLRDFVEALPGYRIHRIVRDGMVPVDYDELWEIFTTTNFLAVRAQPAPSAAG